MTRKQRRLVLIGGGLGVLALAAVLVLSALKDSIVFFNSPTDVVEKQVEPGTRIRLGGLVKPGSVARGRICDARFEVTDGKTRSSGELSGHPAGSVPRRAGRGRRRRARRRRQFRADTVLAKHDENYMPKEVADALKKQGHWKDDYGKKPGSAQEQDERHDRRDRPLRAGAGARRWRWSRRSCRWSARGWRDAALMGVAGPTGAGAVRLRRGVLRRADRLLCRLRFLGRSTSSRIRIRRSRCSTRSPASGGTTKARCCCGC